jgi:PAS domain S-box-containing protein
MKKFSLRSELLLQLLESSQDGIVIAEREGEDTILVYVNPAFEKLTGYTSDEILYQDCRFLQGEDTKQDAVKVIRQSIDSKKAVRTVLKNYRKDGSVFWNELSITPYYDSVDKVTYYIGVQKDVTDQVKLAEELNRIKVRLAELESRLV